MYIKWCTGSSIVIRYLKRAFWCALGTHVLCGAILAQDRPNVLIIYSDEGLESPDVDLLAAEGIEWNHFLGYGNPALDMAAILAGKYPLRLGVRGQWYREGAIDEEEVLLSEVFRAQGYTTAFFGSWYHGGQFPQTPGAQGFDSYFGHSLLPTGITPSGCPIYPQPGKNDLLALHLLDWLAIPRQNPFFAVAALEERAAFQIARTPVGRLVEKPNHSKGIVRQIMDRLDELMLREQTIVVLVGLPGNNALPIGYPVEGRGIVLWRGFLTSARLPYPAVPMDIFPTVAGLCQISVPEGLYIDGIHLNAIMQGAPDHTDGRPLFFNYADRGLRPFPGMAMWKSRWLELANGTDTAGLVPDFLLSDRVWSEGEETAYWLRSAYLEWYQGLEVSSGILAVPVQCGADTVCIAPEACLRNSPGLQGGIQGEPPTEVTDTLIWELLVCRGDTMEVELEGRLPNKKNRLIVEFRSDNSTKAIRMEWEGGGPDLQGEKFSAKVGTVLLREGKGFLRIWPAFPQHGYFQLTSVRLSAPTK